MSARALAVAAACLGIAACTKVDPFGPYDAGPHDAGLPDLGRACAYHDGGGVDFGAIPDFGPIDGPDYDAPPPDIGPPTADLVNGCPPLPACLAIEDTDAGLTYDNFAEPVFAVYCNRCHGSTVTGTDRHAAPDSYTWDLRPSVYAHIPEIRDAIGVSNSMPFDHPSYLSCDLRRGMVTWIDTGAP